LALFEVSIGTKILIYSINATIACTDRSYFCFLKLSNFNYFLVINLFILSSRLVQLTFLSDTFVHPIEFIMINSVLSINTRFDIFLSRNLLTHNDCLLKNILTSKNVWILHGWIWITQAKSYVPALIER